MRILFQGDSITDAGRDRRNYFNLGNGYPKYAAALIRENNPDVDFEFINLGISGNRTDQLFDRLYSDAISLNPDIISILIGINDVWHRFSASKIMTTDDQLILNYRTILTKIKEHTNAKILILTPYILDCDGKDEIRTALAKVMPRIKELAAEFADVIVPLDEHFIKALSEAPERLYYSADGIHPNACGAEFIGKRYAEAIQPLITSI